MVDAGEKPEDVIRKGDTAKAMVISLDKDAKKIALSIKSAVDAQNRGGGHAEVTQSATLADKLKGFSVGGSDEE